MWSCVQFQNFVSALLPMCCCLSACWSSWRPWYGRDLACQILTTLKEVKLSKEYKISLLALCGVKVVNRDFGMISSPNLSIPLSRVDFLLIIAAIGEKAMTLHVLFH